MLAEEDPQEVPDDQQDGAASWGTEDPYAPRRYHAHRYKRPTLQNDHIYLSSISNPNSAEFRPASSPTRQIALMLWASLWWYFHQPEPDPRVTTKASARTAEEGRPKAEWKINIDRQGILKGKNVLAKLERMGLITTEDSSVGSSTDDKGVQGYSQMFVTRRGFWQLDARIYLFTLSPVVGSPMPGSSPFPSRPNSPQLGNGKDSPTKELHEMIPRGAMTPVPNGPFQSNSHLPTFYPPHPAQYTFTNGIRHPIRPKPFRQGEIFYTRFIPSVGQYLSFRITSLSPRGVCRQGPWNSFHHQGTNSMPGSPTPHQSVFDVPVSALSGLDLHMDNDVDLLNHWMNEPRVAQAWGEQGSRTQQEQFLQHGLSSRHSFPAIGCWDGKPFGYFEIYWVKEDTLGKFLGGEVGDWDRGIHCLVGEQEFRGPHRVRIWLSALVHYCWLADMRTNAVMLEPRIDNIKSVHPASRLDLLQWSGLTCDRLANYCQELGFCKEREISFPHKQSNLMKIRRDAWEKPVI